MKSGCESRRYSDAGYGVLDHEHRDTEVAATPPARLMSELGRLIGIPALALSSDGSCQLVFDSCHTVSLVFIPALRNLVISCPCSGSCAIDAKAAMMALRANFMGCGSNGGSLSLGPDGRLHLQFQLTLVGTDAELVLDTIEKLLNRVESWQRRISATTHAEQTNRSLAILAQRG